MSITAKDREAWMRQRNQDAAEYLACPNCKSQMEWIAALGPPNDQGMGGPHLYQCPSCKTVGTKDRFCSIPYPDADHE